MNKKYAIHFGPAPSKTPQSTENAHSTTVASILVELTALASLETTLTGNRCSQASKLHSTLFPICPQFLEMAVEKGATLAAKNRTSGG